jgi:hypothetical protein
VKSRAHAGQLPDILEIFTGLEPDGSAGGNAHFLPRPRIAADAALARLHLKHAKPTQLNTITTLHGETHGIKDCIDCHLSLDFGDVGDLRNLVDDIDLDHG